MRYIERSGNFKRNAKLMWARGKNQKRLLEVVESLAKDLPLPKSKRDHPLIAISKTFVNATSSRIGC